MYQNDFKNKVNQALYELRAAEKITVKKVYDFLAENWPGATQNKDLFKRRIRKYLNTLAADELLVKSHEITASNSLVNTYVLACEIIVIKPVSNDGLN